MSSSPTSPNLSSSPLSFPSPSPSLPAWHFPFGPSSVYHQRERRKTQHSRFKSSYTPRAPVLSTEKRAHRRAQNSSLGSLTSPPLSECSRSPLSRFASYSPATMAVHKNNHAPITPAKSSRRSTCSLQDSPFSDYFSDDARSSVNHNSAIPSRETKALLVRMNRLQAQLMRDHSDTQRQSVDIVEKKLGEIELELKALHSQTRTPSELDDSAVFMPEQDAAVKTPSHSRGPSTQSVDSSAVFSDDAPTAEAYRAERDWMLLRTQDILADLSGVREELRQRHTELKELNDLHSVAIEEKDTQIEQLRYENEALRQDLGFEYSELLFLKLQMKGLECDVAEIRDEKHDSLPITEAERLRRQKKNSILSELDRWRTDSDWQDVSARFKRRRSKYGIATSPVRSNEDFSASLNGEPDIEWELETQRENRGRVTSLTIKRMNSNHGGIPKQQDTTIHTERHRSVTLDGTTDIAAQTTSPKLSPPTPHYVETSTQTDFPLPSQDPLDEDSHTTFFHNTDDEEADFNQDADFGDSGIDPDHDDEDDCAITTSASSEVDPEDEYQDVEEDEETILDSPTLLNSEQQSGWRPAWKELWAGLQSLSGMAEDDDDEEDD